MDQDMIHALERQGREGAEAMKAHADALSEPASQSAWLRAAAELEQAMESIHWAQVTEEDNHSP